MEQSLNINDELIIVSLSKLARNIHSDNEKWWNDLDTGEPIPLTMDLVLSKIALCHSELSEALEGYRKNLMDDKLPHRPMIEVELADAIIRELDLAQRLGLDVAGAIIEKMAYNRIRLDHTIEHRKSEHGKKV